MELLNNTVGFDAISIKAYVDSKIFDMEKLSTFNQLRICKSAYFTYYYILNNPGLRIPSPHFELLEYQASIWMNYILLANY